MKISNELKVGILIIICLVGLVILTLSLGDFHVSQGGYKIKVIFQNIDGVESNAPVRLNGLEVGLVKDIKVNYEEDKTRMELTLWLNDRAKIRKGAEAYVKNMGLMGEKYVGLTTGEDGQPFLKPGQTIIGQEPVDFESLIATGEDIAKNLKDISANIKERLDKNKDSIDEIIGNVNVATKNIASITDNVDERMAINKNSLDEIVENLNRTTRNLEELSEDLKNNPWKLLKKERKK